MIKRMWQAYRRHSFQKVALAQFLQSAMPLLTSMSREQEQSILNRVAALSTKTATAMLDADNPKDKLT